MRNTNYSVIPEVAKRLSGIQKKPYLLDTGSRQSRVRYDDYFPGTILYLAVVSTDIFLVSPNFGKRLLTPAIPARMKASAKNALQ
jgi:hypothetical protein